MSRMKLLTTLLICTLVTGCTGSETNERVDAPVVQEPVIEDVSIPEVSNENCVSYIQTENKVNPTKNVVYSYKDTIPIISDGVVIAYAKVKRFTKLGIWDWSNEDAVRKSVKHSYAINIQIKKSKQCEPSFSISCIPSFINSKNKEVGEYCKVGWSGFPESADFYSADKHISVELGIQPNVKNEKDLKIKLVFFDGDGKQLNTVVISHDIFKSVVKGPDIVVDNSPIVIKSSNGGKYSIQLKNVKKYVNDYDVEGQVPVVDFKYRIKYLAKPTKKEVVPTFDPNNKLALNTSIVLGMQTDKSNEITYNAITTNVHVDDYGNLIYYLKDGKQFLRQGQATEYYLNRPLENQNSKYVRFILEFPEEAKATSDDQLRKFNGRYRVIQCRISNGK